MPGMDTMKQLKRFLHGRLDVDRTGGVLFMRDDTTLILADKSTFTSTQAKLLEAVFPHVRFSVVSCETSASGFIVIFGCDVNSDRGWQRSAVRLMLHVLCFTCAVWASTR